MLIVPDPFFHLWVDVLISKFDDDGMDLWILLENFSEFGQGVKG